MVECPSVSVEPPVAGKVKEGRLKVLVLILEVAISGVVVLEVAGVAVLESKDFVKSIGVDEDPSGVVVFALVVSIAGVVVVVFSDVASVVLATSLVEDQPCQPSLFSRTAPRGFA